MAKRLTMKLTKEEKELMRLVKDFESMYNVDYLTQKPFFEYMRMAFVMGCNFQNIVNNGNKEVVGYDINGNEKARYLSVKRACIHLGCCDKTLKKVVQNGSIFKAHVWKYE